MFTCLGLLNDFNGGYNLQEATPQHATPSICKKYPRMQGGQCSRRLNMAGGEELREASSKQRKLEAFVWENQLCHPVTLARFSIQILENSKIIKLSCNLFLTHLRAQIVCYELKEDLSPVMLKEIFHDSFENFEITRICMENHAYMTGWQKLFFSYKCL